MYSRAFCPETRSKIANTSKIAAISANDFDVADDDDKDMDNDLDGYFILVSVTCLLISVSCSLSLVSAVRDSLSQVQVEDDI